jgi:tetratricopeptide (TPR) repeat protein
LGNCYTELNDLNSARVFFEKAIQVDSCCIDAYYNLGNTFCKLNEPVAAIECYRQAINLSPDLPYIYYNLANTLTVLERFDEAIKYYEHIQPLYIGNADYCINLAQCFFHKRNYKLSIDWVLKSLKIRENNPEAFNYLGRIYALIGEDFKAAEFYLKAHEADKDNEAYIYNLAISFVQLDCYDQGYKYAMALKTVANRLMIQHYVMSILAKWNQWEDTTKQLQKNKLQEGVTGWDFLRISDSADEQYQLMTHYSSKNFPTNNSLGPFLDKTKNKKIKIAYFSPDFRRHAVMHLAGEIFKMHDRSEFEIHGFSMHPGHTDADRESLKNYFDFLYEINQLK